MSCLHPAAVLLTLCEASVQVFDEGVGTGRYSDIWATLSSVSLQPKVVSIRKLSRGVGRFVACFLFAAKGPAV